jgi:hypothetical protein
VFVVTRKVITRNELIAIICVMSCIAIVGYFVKSCSDMGNYEKQVKGIKKRIPVSVQFIEENEEFLDVLLAVAEKMRGYAAVQNIDADITDTWLFKFYYSNDEEDVIITKNSSIFKGYGGRLNDMEIKSLISEYENYVIHETMSKKMSSKKNNQGREIDVIVNNNQISIHYFSYLLANLSIDNPPREVEESDDYYEYSYGIKVNDDWGIYLQRYGKAN